jgi:hypothetical protein
LPAGGGKEFDIWTREVPTTFRGREIGIETVTTETFNTGAIRDSKQHRLDYEGFFNPLVMEAFARYMHKSRFMESGDFRDSDNWQKGIPKDSYIKSGLRHMLDLWKEHRGYKTKDGVLLALLGLMFNVQGYILETLKEDPEMLDRVLPSV